MDQVDPFFREDFPELCRISEYADRVLGRCGYRAELSANIRDPLRHSSALGRHQRATTSVNDRFGNLDCR
jgi:hypothetical protein